MIELPDSLRTVFSATVHERDGAYVVEVPSNEIEHGSVAGGETYRVAVLETLTDTGSTSKNAAPTDSARRDGQHRSRGPPVEEGEIRDVTIETIGDQGDGIAKVERGYVLIVPDVEPGQQPTVEIEEVRENVAFASVVERRP